MNSLFNHTGLEVTNPFDLLQSSNDVTSSHIKSTNNSSSSSDHPGSPQHASSPVHSRKGKQHPKPRSMKVLNINFQSIKNKKEELTVLLESTCPSIVIGTETWLNPTITSSEIFPPNYEVIRKDREDGYGGVLLAVRNDLVYDIIQTGISGEHVFAKLTFGQNTNLIVGALYRPPNSDIHYLDEMCSTVEELAVKNKKAALWIAGDLNLPDINWEDLNITGHNNSVSMNNRLLDMVQTCAFQQMVTFPTRKENILDLFLTNRPTLVNKCTPLPGLGDHDIVCVDTDVSAKRRKPVKRLIHIWRKANLQDLKKECLSFQQQFLNRYNEQSSITDMWVEIKTTLLSLTSKHVPSKLTSSRFNQPWVTSAIKRLARKKKRAFRRARSTGQPQDFKKYKELKKSAQTACKQAFNNFVTNIISPESSANPKRFWSFINSKRNDRTGVTPLKANNGTSVTDSVDKANMLNDQFTSVFNKDEDLTTIKDKGHSPYPDMAPIHIFPAGVYKLLSTLDMHKATGPDGLQARLLKELAAELTPVFTVLFQASVNQGLIPDDWKEADVVPIFKKGERCRPENYRPVSLTSIVCKTLEHIVCSNIHQHLDNHDILCDAQHGFRKKRSCTSQLLLTIQDLAKGIDNGEQLDVILLDLSKAFDKVPQNASTFMESEATFILDTKPAHKPHPKGST